MADSPLKGTEGVQGLTVKLDGRPIPDATLVQSVHVSRALGRVPLARIVILSGANEVEEFDELDSNAFKIGTKVKIEAFWGSGAGQEIFAGTLMALRLRVNATVGQSLELTCRDDALRLQEMPMAGQFEMKKDSDVMKQIIQDAGLSAEIAATQRTWDQVVTAASPWEIVKLLADRNGMVVDVYDGKITVKKPAPEAAEKLEVTLGVDVYDYDITLDAQRMIKDATYLGWDSATQKTIEGKSTDPKDPKLGNLKAEDYFDVLRGRSFKTTVGAQSAEADLKNLAAARLDRAAFGLISGTCKFIGSGKIAPGDTLMISASGQRFGGKAYVSGVVHAITEGNWTTTTHLGLPQDWVSDGMSLGGPGAAGIATPVSGLQVGTVMQVNEDPDDLQRVLVSMPMIGAEEVKVWARLGTPYASKDAGIQFLPEVDDEVIVGFLSDDPNAPIILGALHNAKAKRPEVAVEDNFIKKIVTREKLSITFDDDKKILTLETPAGHKITMDDDAKSITMKDMGGSTVTLDDTGISLKTSGDISLEAGGKVDVKATQDASISGANVSCEGDQGFTGKGGASAEVSSGGQTEVTSGGTTTVKGAMVMIN